MMTGTRKILNKADLAGWLALLTAGLLSACGGSLVGGIPDEINYSGLTSQAVLTSDNDDAFGTAMLEGGAASGDARNQMKDAPFIGASVNGNATQGGSKNQFSAMESLIQAAIASIQQRQDSTGAVANLQATVVGTGGCGGNIDVSGADSSGGAITFNDYCNELTVGDLTITTTINGTMSFSITGDIQSGVYEISINFTAITLTVDDGTQSITHHFSGTITVSQLNGGFPTTTYSINFQREGKVFKVENPLISGSSPDINISARLYHPDFGYVDIETDPNDKFARVGDQYCDGTLIITAVDNNGSTVISTMTVNPTCTEYTISHNGGPAEVVSWP